MFYDLEALAELLQSDASATLALVLEGAIPKPHLIGGRLVRWSVVSLREWSAAGCPTTAPLASEEATALRRARIAELHERDWATVEDNDSKNWLFDEDIIA